MTSKFKELQEYIKNMTKDTYSETVIEHIMNPRNLGDMENADGFASVTGPCGDTMEIWLRIENNRVVEATFRTDGCGTTLASGSMVTEISKGKSIKEALKISRQDVLHALGGLPEKSQHCALLSANTLKEAITEYMAVKRDPWKRAYRKYFGNKP